MVKRYLCFFQFLNINVLNMLNWNICFSFSLFFFSSNFRWFLSSLVNEGAVIECFIELLKSGSFFKSSQEHFGTRISKAIFPDYHIPCEKVSGLGRFAKEGLVRRGSAKFDLWFLANCWDNTVFLGVVHLFYPINFYQVTVQNIGEFSHWVIFIYC